MFKIFKHKNPKEKYLIDFELIYFNDIDGLKYISPYDFHRFLIDYANYHNISIKNLSVNQPKTKSFVEVTTRSEYVSFLNCLLEPCNAKWTKIS